MREIDSCEVCGAKDLHSVLDLGLNPLCDDLIPFDSKKVSKEYQIEILFCDVCQTAHQRFQVPPVELFTDSYHYRARMTGSVLEGMSDLVEEVEKFKGGLNQLKVLDIGTNDGSLLDFFASKGCQTLGVEPTSAARDSKHEVIQDFFNAATAERVLNHFGKPDIITFTNVFAHIDDLNGLLSTLKMLMHNETLLVIENHYLGAVLEYGQVDTFYHEHPRTYSRSSFDYVASKLDRRVSQCQYVSRYGGNIRVFISKDEEVEGSRKLEEFGSKFAELREWLLEWIPETKSRLGKYVNEYGPLRAKAFPGRAAILIKLLDIDLETIKAVYEIKGSQKVGHYVPGTRVPILPESELYLEEDQTVPILNLAWHLPAEVRRNLELNGYTGEVLDLRTFSKIIEL